MSAIHLIGGGRDCTELYQRFIADCPGGRPRIATVLIDEGDGTADVVRFVEGLRQAGDCDPIPVLIPIEDSFDVDTLDGIDGLFVCGGLTPAYAAAIGPIAVDVRAWLNADGHAYAGFSAGASIASLRALVGGWLLHGVPVCHEDTAEDLDELSVVDGLGLVDFAVDVHCAQWGTLTRLCAAVAAGAIATGVGIDENTMLTIDEESVTASGVGRAWIVSLTDGGLAVRTMTAGDHIDRSVLSS